MDFKSVIAGLGLAAIAATAHAACKDDIAQATAQSQSKATAAIANSSGGQGEAAKREAGKADGEQSTGDKAMRAKVALNDAKIALGKGDETGCEAAVNRARENLSQ